MSVRAMRAWLPCRDGLSTAGPRRRPRAVTALARAALAVLAVLAARPGVALAHDGAPPTPQDLWRAWTWDPAILLGLALGAWLYARGLRRLWRRAGWARVVRPWQVAAYAGGLAVLFVALVSPLDALGAALFSAHMVQHLLLILVAAPLLVLGAPLVPLLWALPGGARRTLGGWWRWAPALPLPARPPAAWLLHAAVVWVWHAPALYEAALRHAFVHALEHAAFLGTALLFWWVCVHPARQRHLGYGVSVLLVFAMATQGGVLGALLTFAPTPWYAVHAAGVEAWHLTLLEDQQLAGVLMWVPAGLVYLLASAALFVAWFQAVEQRVRRNERETRIWQGLLEPGGEQGQAR